MSETEQEAPAEPVVPAPGEPEPTPDEEGEGEEEGEPAPPLEQPGEGEGESEPPQAPEPSGLTEKEIEAIHKKLDAEANRHAGRVSDILGEQAIDLVPCPLCLPNIPGFIYPVPPPDEVKAVVKAALGEPVEPKYEKANNARQCEGCNGLGKRLSGSLVPDQRVLLCPDCSGRGWIGVGEPTNGTNAQAATTTFTPAPELAPEDKPATDPWGRTPDDVDYGRLPNYVRA